MRHEAPLHPTPCWALWQNENDSTMTEPSKTRPAVSIRSGGQTGVDRAALQVATVLHLPYHGWCPRGGWAEDQPTPPGILRLYPNLDQTPSSDPHQRTAWNVRDSHVTLILAPTPSPEHSRGTCFAKLCADLVFVKPWRIAELGENEPSAAIASWISSCLRQCSSAPFDLNVAGPRESEVPGIQDQAFEYLHRLLARFA
jgi:hypothetical protein